MGSPTWSPDGKKIAFLAHFDKGSYLWIADAATGKSRQVANTPVLGTLESQLSWLGDSKRIALVLVPAKRAAMPVSGAVAMSPMVKVSDDKANALRTYAGLMNTPYEFDLLEWHVTGQLATIDTDNGRTREIGGPAMIENVSPQPDGSHYRVTLMERPFSYMVPTSSFPEREVIWSAEGKQVVELAKRPLRFGGPATPASNSDNEKRSISWRPDGA